jgi:hypothetical protein
VNESRRAAGVREPAAPDCWAERRTRWCSAVLCLSLVSEAGCRVGNSRGLSLARRTCHSGAVYGGDPLRSVPKPQQRRIHLAVILGRPIPPPQVAVAAGHARHLRWVSVAGTIIAVIGVGMLVVTAFAPHATWSLWLAPASFLVAGAIFLFFGFNASVPCGFTTIQAAEVSGSCR